MPIVEHAVVVTPQERETLLGVARAHGRFVSATRPQPVGDGKVAFRLRLSDGPVVGMGSAAPAAAPVVPLQQGRGGRMWRRRPRLFAALAVFALVVAGLAAWGAWLAGVWMWAHRSQILGCLILSGALFAAVAHYRNKS